MLTSSTLNQRIDQLNNTKLHSNLDTELYDRINNVVKGTLDAFKQNPTAVTKENSLQAINVVRRIFKTHLQSIHGWFYVSSLERLQCFSYDDALQMIENIDHLQQNTLKKDPIRDLLSIEYDFTHLRQQISKRLKIFDQLADSLATTHITS